MKKGAGTLTLSATNTYTGDTAIEAGTVVLTGALSSATDVSLTGTSVWDLRATQTVASLSMASGSSITRGAGTSALTVTGLSTLANSVTTSGTQTYQGAVTLAAATSLTGSTINTQSTLAGGGNALTITGAADIDGAFSGITNLSVSGASNIGANITTSGTQTYVGAATLSANTELAGAGINMAAVTLQSGSTAYTLSLNNTDADSKIEGIVSGTGSLVKKGTGILSLNGDNTYSGTTNVNAGTLKLGHVHALGATTSGSGTTVGANGTLDLNELSVQEPVTVAGGRILNGVLAGDMTLTADSVIEAGAGSSLTLSGDISGSFGLTLSGAGVITLSGDNTYTGETTISSGTVVVASNTGLGSAAGGTTLASGATLDLAGVTVAAESLVLQGGTLKDATSQWGGTISMTADSTFDIGAGDTLMVDGVISGAHVLTKVGGGTLQLNAQNTYSGGTQINVGFVKLGSNAGLGTAAASVASGAALDINGKTIANALSVTGSGISNGGAITNSSNSVATLHGAVTLLGNSTWSSAGGLNIQGAVNASASGAQSLTISNGAVQLLAGVGQSAMLSSLDIAGATTLGADVITSGTQTYGGTVTLSGGHRALTGSVIQTQSTLVGGSNALTITGDADIDGSFTGLTALSISGTSNLGANVTTTGTQTFAGAVTLSGGDRTLAGS